MISEALPLSPTRFMFVFGVVVGMRLYEVRHITTGSIVVPGFIAAYIIAPTTILVTAMNAIFTTVIVQKGIDRVMILYGRQRFVTTAAVAVILGVFSTHVLSRLTNGFLPPLIGIGYVVPALIAHDINRAGARRTLGAVAFAGAATTLPALVLSTTIASEPIAIPDDLGLREIGSEWMPIFVLITTLTVPTLIDRHRLRSGGFIGAVYVALFTAHPAQIFFLIIAALCTFHVVEKLKKITILFGRRKFAAMLAVSGIVSWVILYLAEYVYGPQLLPITQLPLAPLFIPGLLANDMERGSPSSVAVGAVVGGTFTFALVRLCIGLVDLEPVPLWIPLMLAATGFFLFRDRIFQSVSWLVGDRVRPLPRLELLHENR